MDDGASRDLDRIVRERDFYQRLLDLGRQDEFDPFLSEALRIIVEMTDSEAGYLELVDVVDRGEAVWSMAHSLTAREVEKIQTQISRGIVAEALATGETVVTSSAVLDARFSRQESVQAGNIGAVICVPVGGAAGLGAVYLEREASTGLFSDADREAAEVFARHLAPLSDRLVSRARIAKEVDPTRGLREQYDLEGMVGRSEAFARPLEQAMRAAPLDINILLTGESGTGKSQLARAIHDNSQRCAGPLIDLNCAALPDTLVESELFGAVAGAHSTATQNIPGKVAAAEGGTLLLDEIGELPLAAQAKLLHLLQSREYFPLGSTRPVVADIRVIAATNANLEKLVEEKSFRADLFFRLHVLPVELPPLADRREDLRELSQAACARILEENRLPKMTLSEGAHRAIEAAEWPGNIRELESAIAAAAIRAAGEQVRQITGEHLFPARIAADELQADDLELGFQAATRRFQKELLARALERTDWNVSEAARQLDLARSHVYKLIDGFGFERDKD